MVRLPGGSRFCQPIISLLTTDQERNIITQMVYLEGLVTLELVIARKKMIPTYHVGPVQNVKRIQIE